MQTLLMQEKHYLVPHHNEGGATDISYILPTDMVEEAEDLFVETKDRLLEISNWAKFAGIDTLHFKLADSHHHLVSRHARRGDHILISSEGPESIEGYDWYTIDALEYDDYPDDNLETFAIRLRPSAEDAGNKDDTATIVVERNGKSISAIYHGRNNDSTRKEPWQRLDQAQWAALMKGLVEFFD